MPATFNWAQTIGAPPGIRNDLGASGNLVNFKNIDSIGTSDWANYPIPAGLNSYEVFLQGHFTGVFSAIYDFRFWMSQDFAPNIGLTVRAKTTQQVYAQPTNLTSSLALDVVSTSDPGTPNVSVGGSLSSSLTTSGYTDYIVLQLQTQNNAPAGETSLATFSFSYIEI